MADKKKEYRPTKEELLNALRSNQEEDQRNPAVRELGYDLATSEDMTLKSETPPRMVLNLVRMEVLEAARDPERIARGESLMRVFIRAYDRRMVSLNRKGRLELLGALQAMAESDHERNIVLR